MPAVGGENRPLPLISIRAFTSWSGAYSLKALTESSGPSARTFSVISFGLASIASSRSSKLTRVTSEP